MENTELIKRRLLDADRAAYGRNILKICGFLSLEEQSVYHGLEREFMSTRHMLADGTEEADRAAALFMPDYMDEDTAVNEAICAVLARPVNQRFADELTHRDYLGALMNLGIERECIGDIMVVRHAHDASDAGSGRSKQTGGGAKNSAVGGASSAVIFALSEMGEYICRELTRVRHTSVECSLLRMDEYRSSDTGFTQEYEELSVNIASERVDAVTAAVYKVSRQKAADVIAAERVFINGRVVNSAGKPLKAGDRVSVRGTGKYIFDGINGTSRKGRLFADVRKYV